MKIEHKLDFQPIEDLDEFAGALDDMRAYVRSIDESLKERGDRRAASDLENLIECAAAIMHYLRSEKDGEKEKAGEGSD